MPHDFWSSIEFSLFHVISVNFQTGASATHGWSYNFSPETKRSSVPCREIHCSRARHLLSHPACHGFRKPSVSF